MASKYLMNNSNSLGTTSATVFHLNETIIEAADAVIGGLILDKAAITWMYSILNLQYICQEPLSRYKSDVEGVAVYDWTVKSQLVGNFKSDERTGNCISQDKVQAIENLYTSNKTDSRRCNNDG